MMRREEHYVGEESWLECVLISERRDCRRRNCTTVLHGGVCQRTSIPLKNGNNMKSKKKKRTGKEVVMQPAECHSVIAAVAYIHKQ